MPDIRLPANGSPTGANTTQNFRITIAALRGQSIPVRPARKKCPVMVRVLNGTSRTMTGLLIGCAHVSTNGQDLTARKYALVALGVPSEKTFTGQGLARADRARPAHKEALAA